MSRFAKYNMIVGNTVDETKIGGDPQKAIAWAILALAEAILVTESDGKVEISGSVMVES